MARYLPVPGFNSIVGVRAGRRRTRWKPLVAWYRENEVKPRVEMVPGLVDAKLARELARLGFFHSGFQTSLICDTADVPPSEAAVSVDVVSTPDVLRDVSRHAREPAGAFRIPGRVQGQCVRLARAARLDAVSRAHRRQASGDSDPLHCR